MPKVVIGEQQARDIASRIPASSCASVHIQDDGLLHDDMEIDIDSAGLRRGKTETLVCLLYEAPDKKEEQEETDEAESQQDDAAASEPSEEPDDSEQEEDRGDDVDDAQDKEDYLGAPIILNKEKGHVTTIMTKVAIPDDEIIKTVKISLTKTFPELAGKTVRIAAIPYRSKKPLLMVLAALAILAVIIGIIISGWGDPRAKKGYYDGKSKEEIQRDLDSQVDWYSMEISVANAMVMNEGSTEVEARIENVVNNHCDQKVKMYPNGHPEDVLFSSGAIRPGEYIQTVNLSHPLPVGRHAITVEFQGYDQNMTLMSNEGQFLGHDTFGASCAAEVTIDVRPADATYADEG